MNKLFEIACRAASIHDRERGVWVSCVTPAEAIKLINAGADPYAVYDREMLVDLMDAGQSRKIWFYFKVKTNSKLSQHLCVEKRHG